MLDACPEFSDIDSIRQKAIILGNSAHEVRNFLAMTKKTDLPELIAIDTLAAQVENQARQFVQQSIMPTNLLKPETGKLILRAIFRTNKFVLRNLKCDTQDLGYSLMAKDQLELLQEHINLQQKIVKSLDKSLNDVFSNYMGSCDDSNVVILKQKEEFEEKPLYTDLNYRNLQMNMDIMHQSINLNDLIKQARDTCNKAHSIQNTICTYQTIEKVKNSSNQINNHAGNIENQFRAILQAFGQQTNNPGNVKNVINNQIKAVKEQLSAINTHYTTVSSIYPEIKDIQSASEAISSAAEYFTQVANQKIIDILS